MEDDLINQIRYEIQPPEAWKSAVPDQRTIYTRLDIPAAHAALEQKFHPHKIVILHYQKARFLPAPQNI